MIFPKGLKDGDTIGLIAPSSPITNEELDLCANLVEDMGYNVKLGRSITHTTNGYSAGTGEERAADINQMFADHEVKAIWCLRGGDTSSHVMDKIDFEMVRNNPKIFVGYSDVTNLHVSFNQNCHLVTFHGPMVKSNMLEDFDDFTKVSFETALNMEEELVFENPRGEEIKTMVEGRAEGTIVGGNLALLTSMIGTPYEVDAKGKILFLEDDEETVKRLDRMMYQLKYSNKLEEAAGIIFGDFTNCVNLDDERYNVIEMLKDILADYDKPVMFNIKSGHDKPMATIPLGVTCRMDTNAKLIKFIK